MSPLLPMFFCFVVFVALIVADFGPVVVAPARCSQCARAGDPAQRYRAKPAKAKNSLEVQPT